MKTCTRVVFLTLIVALVALLVACGKAVQVESCEQCRGSETCVEGEYDTLYCADPCLRHVDCLAGYWCVPLEDQESYGHIQWVCMPARFYTDLGRVWYWGSYDCTEPPDECDVGMQCLQDPDTLKYFCSDACLYDSDCLSDCCLDTGEGDYCAPYFPYCSQ